MFYISLGIKFGKQVIKLINLNEVRVRVSRVHLDIINPIHSVPVPGEGSGVEVQLVNRVTFLVHFTRLNIIIIYYLDNTDKANPIVTQRC